MRSRAPWLSPSILVTLFCIFLSGAAAGALTMRMTMSPERHLGPYWREGGEKISLQRFTRELNLTPEQEREMETVLDDFMTYYQTLQAQMDDVRSTGKQRILKILRDDQKQRFEKMIGDITGKQLR
jgi:Spy/CpxP family protein refolding chaperone